MWTCSPPLETPPEGQNRGVTDPKNGIMSSKKMFLVKKFFLKLTKNVHPVESDWHSLVMVYRIKEWSYPRKKKYGFQTN